MSDTPQNTFWNVPFGRNPFFTGREELLARLQTPLPEGSPQIRGITGPRGVGKTQLAVEYAYRHREDYKAVFWVSAESIETLYAGYDEIARLLNLPLKEYPEQDVVVRAVKTWLEDKSNWLLILDNVDQADILSRFLLQKPLGQILITARAQNLADQGIVELLSVDPFTRDQGARFQLQRAGFLSLDAPFELAQLPRYDLATRLAHDLDGLPLPLEYAAAYIDVTGMDLDTYRQAFQRRRTELLAQHQAPPAHLNTATIVSLAFQRVEERSPATAAILCLCAFLADMPISEEVLIVGANAADGHPTLVGLNAYRLNQATAELAASALISRDAQTKTLTVHRLVQEAISHYILSTEKQRQWKQLAVNTISASFPDVSSENWAAIQRLLPHALLCTTWIEEENFETPEAARLLDRAGCYLAERGRDLSVEALYQQALAIRETLFGENHPETIPSLDNLALLYKNQGEREQSKYAEAEALYKRVLAIKNRIKADKYEVARSQIRLASVYTRRGKYVEAERLYKRAMKIYRRWRWRGQEHPDMAASLNNLASLYAKQRRYAEAEDYYEQALKSRERYKGTSHADMATSLDNLAGVEETLGKYDRAEELYQRSLTIREEHLGSWHPDTANSLNNLALLYTQQKKYEKAQGLYDRALEICKQHLGDEHPGTASILNNLALLYEGQGKYEEAESLYRQALAICERFLGSEHPDTITCLNNLALLFAKQGKYGEAQQLYQRSPAIRERLGNEYPSTATSLNNLASLYANQGRYAEAESLYQRAFAIDRKVYGEEHAEIVTDLNNLASLSMKQGKYEEAERLLKRALDILEQTVDPKHPNIGAVLSNLALVLQKRQGYDKAEEYYREGLRIDRAYYGPQHSAIAADFSNLGALLYVRERADEAEYFFRRALEIDQALLSPSHPRLKIRLENLAHVLKASGREDEAAELLSQVAGISERQTDSISPDAQERKES